MSVYAGIDILDGRDLGERGVVFLKLLVFIPGERMTDALTVGPREAVEAVRVAYRDRAKHISVEERKERQIESEAKGDRSRNGKHEPRVAPKTPERISNVLQRGLEKIDPAHAPTIFLHRSDSAEVETGEAGSFLLGVSGFEVLAVCHRQVELNLILEFLFHARAEHQRTQPQQEITQGHAIFPQASSITLLIAT